MSADRPMPVRMGTDSDGKVMLGMPYDEGLAQKAVEEGLSRKTSNTEPGPNTTPDPEGEHTKRGGSTGGPIARFNDVFTDLGSVQLEAVALDGYEISNATSTLRDEMYRTTFPIIQPRFVVKGVESGHEYGEEVPFDIEAAREAMERDGHANPPTDPEDIPEQYRDFEVRRPNAAEKKEAERLAERVNKEGQSLREIMKALEDDQSRLGVSTLIVKKSYVVARGDSMVYDRGEVINENPEELVRGDPKRIVPVVDDNGRIGGWKWTCPIHRDEALTEHTDYEDGVRRCGECGADLREVFFVEKEQTSMNNERAVKYFFEDEVVTWARYHPRLHGLDGLAPTHHVWLKQAILHWMDVYGAAFYDPQSDRYPNKFMVVHTTNPDAWERQFQKAEDDAKENPYSEQIMFNEYSPESSSTPEVQVIDLMNDELLGQDEQMKKQYKSDIRQNWGVTDVFDSQLEDAGGLNNEGLQLEVTDRSVATAMHDTETGPLDELSKTLGIEDYTFGFVPPSGKDPSEVLEHVRAGKQATDAGLEARFEGGEVEISDGEFETAEEEGGGGLAGLFGGAEDDGVGAEGLAEKVAEKAEEPADSAPEPGDHSGPGDGPDPREDGDGDGDPDDGTESKAEGDEHPFEPMRRLDDAFEHVVWADGEQQKADPFWDEVPELVLEKIREVLDEPGVLWRDFQTIPTASQNRIKDVFERTLADPDGWSLGAVADALEREFGVDHQTAELVGRTEAAKVFNHARERGYRDIAEEVDEEPRFEWIGPKDHRTTDACEEMSERTSGGVPLDELIEIERDVQQEHFPDLHFRRHVIHPNERHTFVETFKLDHPSADDVEVEHEWDVSPPMGGTFVEVGD